MNWFTFGLMLLLVTYDSHASSGLEPRQILKCEASLNSPRVETQIRRLELVHVERERTEQWLKQFPPEDQDIATELLERLDLIDYPELMRATRRLHHQLRQRLATDIKNDALTHVDFTRPYIARSGDLISYVYRKTNLVRSVQFFSTEQLESRAAPDRDLVILDDYASTGAQLLIEYFGANAEVLRRYRKVYLLVIAANTKAIGRARGLRAGEHQRIAAEINAEFNLQGADAEAIRQKAAAVSKQNFELLYDRAEQSLRPDPRLEAFLKRYANFGQNSSAPFGCGGTAGSTAFFYGCPNSLPDALWNSLGEHQGHPWRPLFSRTEDISHYDFAAQLPHDAQVWGGK